MKDHFLEREIAIQNSMVAAARSTFSDAELNHLRCLVRLTVEFAEYLLHLKAGLPWRPELPALPSPRAEAEYVAGSVFAGIDSFRSVTHAYRILVDSLESEVTLSETFSVNLEQEFLSKYQDFTTEADFQRQCRLLLDLFKLQIVFAGLVYD